MQLFFVPAHFKQMLEQLSQVLVRLLATVFSGGHEAAQLLLPR